MPRNGETAFDHLASAERARTAFAPDESGWSFPDMGVLRLYRRAPPSLPLMVFGPWEAWIAEQGEAAACPVSYVAGPLLAAASALIGHARQCAVAAGGGELVGTAAHMGGCGR